MLSPLPDFTCAICRRLVDMRFSYNPGRRDVALPPLCLWCEHDFSRGVGKPSAGSLRDRRIVRQGVALAEGLRTAAAHKQWGGRFGQP